MRLKYPHLSVGALASSAPVLQFEDIVPPETFYDIVSNVFRVRFLSPISDTVHCINMLWFVTCTFSLDSMKVEAVLTL